MTKKSIIEHLKPIINTPVYQREGIYQLKAGMEWINNYLQLFSYVIPQNKAHIISFSDNKVSIENVFQ